MGDGERVVGVSNYDHFPAGRVAAARRSAGCSIPNVERILALQPDLVIVYATQTELNAAARSRRHSVFLLRASRRCRTS